MENVILSPITLTDLQGVVSESVQQALKSYSEQLATPTPRIVDGEVIEESFNITRQTLARWRKENRIPFIQVGGVIRYDLNKVIEALENRKKKGGYNG